MIVTDMPVEKLVPYARNPRNNTAAIDAVKASIAEFGFRQPIVVDEKLVVIVGHTRLEAAKQLGLKTVPVHVAEGLSPAQAKAYRLMDNRSHENAEWDDELLRLEFGDLKLDDFDLALTGFVSDELDKLLGAEQIEGLTDPDEAPEVPAKAVSKPGDLWILGGHRVLCGDSTVMTDVEKLMGGQLADMAVTDPPYNVDYGNSAKDKMRGKDRRILNDALGKGFHQFLYDTCVNLLMVTKGACYICMSSSELHTLQKAFTEAGGKWSTFIIWAKNTFTLGRADYQRQYEPILYGWREGSQHYWCGARDQGDVWFVDKPRINDLHPTMKPVELIERAITNSSKSRDIVLDLFGGSGTTLIAAERTGRSARLLELDPKYTDVIVERWQNFTGGVAVLEGEDRTFDDLKAIRGSEANVRGRNGPEQPEQ
ncbi:DNA modification methylase [Aestuariivirga sp.]|uniref:DNA modification methylase n=1 Tax=Aestuariivirga sp. TaxID=2650926 RepID=UPI00391CA877